MFGTSRRSADDTLDQTQTLPWISAPLCGVAAALLLAVAWDLGYSWRTFETAATLLSGVAFGAILSILTKKSVLLRKLALLLLAVALVDVFFVGDPRTGALLTLAAVGLAVWLKARVPDSVILISAIVFALGIGWQTPAPLTQHVAKADSGQEGPPQLVVHLVLDALGTWDAFPDEYRNLPIVSELEAAYRERGLQTVEGVRSISERTEQSLSAMAAMSSEFSADLVEPYRSWFANGYRATSDQFFRQFVQEGWDTNVWQSSYLTFCDETSQIHCVTYDAVRDLRGLDLDKLTLRQRLRVMSVALVSRIALEVRGWSVARGVASLVAKFHLEALPTYHSEGVQRPGDMAHMLRTDGRAIMTQALANPVGPSYIFMHLLLPHAPWVLNADCELSAPDAWVGPSQAWVDIEGARAAAFAAAWEQTICTHKTVLQLIDELDKLRGDVPVSFLIHSDHGPRILSRYFEPTEVPGNPEPAWYEEHMKGVFYAERLPEPQHVFTLATGSPTLQTLLADRLPRLANKGQTNPLKPPPATAAEPAASRSTESAPPM